MITLRWLDPSLVIIMLIHKGLLFTCKWSGIINYLLFYCFENVLRAVFHLDIKTTITLRWLGPCLVIIKLTNKGGLFTCKLRGIRNYLWLYCFDNVLCVILHSDINTTITLMWWIHHLIITMLITVVLFFCK
jgi:hypothetical protein